MCVVLVCWWPSKNSSIFPAWEAHRFKAAVALGASKQCIRWDSLLFLKKESVTHHWEGKLLAYTTPVTEEEFSSWSKLGKASRKSVLFYNLSFTFRSVNDFSRWLRRICVGFFSIPSKNFICFKFKFNTVQILWIIYQSYISDSCQYWWPLPSLTLMMRRQVTLASCDPRDVWLSLT